MTAPANIDNCPKSYARHLAYLGCPRKVQNRTHAYFGRAPSLAFCEKVIAERGKVAANHTPGRECDDCGDGIDRGSKTGLCAPCFTARQTAERRARATAELAERMARLAERIARIPEKKAIPAPAFGFPVGVVAKAIDAAVVIFGVPRNVLLSPCRKHARARQAVMLVACEQSKLSLIQIGQRLGRDHSTVIHGRDQALWRTGWDQAYAAQVDALRAAVGEVR